MKLDYPYDVLLCRLEWSLLYPKREVELVSNEIIFVHNHMSTGFQNSGKGLGMGGGGGGGGGGEVFSLQGWGQVGNLYGLKYTVKNYSGQTGGGCWIGN